MTELTRLQAVGCSCVVLSRGLGAGTALLFCWVSVRSSLLLTGIKNMMNWVTHLSPQNYLLAEIKAQVSVCQTYRYICLCLFKYRLSACCWGAIVLLFILAPYSSHKVNWRDDLYLRRYLRDITSLAIPSVWREQKYAKSVCVFV